MSTIDTIAHPEHFRNEVRKRLATIVLSATAESDDLTHTPDTEGGAGTDNIPTNIEKGVYNWAIQHASKHNIVKKWSNPFFVTLYIDRLRSVYINLKNPSVAELVVQQKIPAKDFAFMTHQEICPEKWKKLIEDKKVRDKQKYEPNIEASTDNFTCNKCKSKKCTYYQLQTRSADEPMTTFVTCLECGKRWKC
jgi:transcription elongation factor S-II